MSIARYLLNIYEAGPSDFDRGLGRALGVKMPDDWNDQSTIDSLPDSIFRVSKTFQKVSWPDEDDGNGPDEEGGYDYENEELDWDSLIREIKWNGFTELSNVYRDPAHAGGTWLSTPDPETDDMTGEQTYYSLHISAVRDPHSPGWRAISGPELNAIFREAGITR